MKNIFLKSATLAFVSIILTNCASKKIENNSQSNANLNGVWELTSLSSEKHLEKKFPNTMPTLFIENNNNKVEAYGNDGCNKYQSSIELKKDNKLQLNPVVVTRMMCEKVASDLYLKNLSEVNSYQVSENILKLNTPTDTLKFYRVSLEGKWVLDKLNTVKKKVSDLYPYRRPFINININSNQLTGNTACNNITAQILIYENKMSFKHVLTNKMFCDGIAEKDFTDALARTTNYELKGTRLLLFENEKVLMEFKRDFEK